MIRTTSDKKDTMLIAKPKGYMSKKSAHEIEKMKTESQLQRTRHAAAAIASVQVRPKIPNGVFSEPRKIRGDVEDTLATSIKNVLPDYSTFKQALNTKNSHLLLGIDNTVPVTPEVADNNDMLSSAFTSTKEEIKQSQVTQSETTKTVSTTNNVTSKRNHQTLPATTQKVKPPSLVMPLKELTSSENHRASQSKIENILKEMTQDHGPPLTDIETPIKGKGFKFPKTMPINPELCNGSTIPKTLSPLSKDEPPPNKVSNKKEANLQELVVQAEHRTNHRSRGLSTSSTSSSDGSSSDSESDSSDSETESKPLEVEKIPASPPKQLGLLNSAGAAVMQPITSPQHVAEYTKDVTDSVHHDIATSVDQLHTLLDTSSELPSTPSEMDHLSLLAKSNIPAVSSSLSEADNGMQPQSAPNVYLMSSSVIGGISCGNNSSFSFVPNSSMFADFNLEKPISPLPTDKLFDPSPDHQTLTSPFATNVDGDLFGGADDLSNIHSIEDCSNENDSLKLPSDFHAIEKSNQADELSCQQEAMEISDDDEDLSLINPNIICGNEHISTPNLTSHEDIDINSHPRIQPVSRLHDDTPKSNAFNNNNNQDEDTILCPMANSLKVKIPLCHVNMNNIYNSPHLSSTSKPTLHYHSNGNEALMMNYMPSIDSIVDMQQMYTNDVTTAASINPMSKSTNLLPMVPVVTTIANTNSLITSTPVSSNTPISSNSLPVKIDLSKLKRIPSKIHSVSKKRKLSSFNDSAIKTEEVEIEPEKPNSVPFPTVKAETTDCVTHKKVKREKDSKSMPTYETKMPSPSNICTTCGFLRKDSGKDRSRKDTYRTSYEKFLSQGRKLKHVADGYTDFKEKGLKYIEAVLSYLQFLVGLECSKKTEVKTGLEQFMQVNSQCITLIDHVSNHCARKKTKSHPVVDKRFLYLCLRMQSMLYFKLYNMKKDSTTKISKLLSEYYKAFKPRSDTTSYLSNSRGLSASPGLSPNPSPGGSVASYGSSGSSGSADKGPPTSQSMMSIPVDMYQKAQQYLNQTKFLLHGNRLWAESMTVADSCQEFILELSLGVGRLTMESSLIHLVDYITAGLMLIQRNPLV